MLVLIVDDDRDASAELSAALEDHGYRTWVCPDGATALGRMRERQPNMVLLDLLMPGFSGHRVYDEMQRDPALARIPVLIVTGEPTRAPIGVPAIAKPVRIDKLLALLDMCRSLGSAQ